MTDEEQPQTAEQLHRRLDAGEASIRELWRACLPVVHATVARELYRRRGIAAGRNPRQELEDAVQDVAVTLFRSGGRLLRTWDETRGLSFHGFLRMISRQEVIRIFRSGRRNPWTEDPTEDDALAAAATSGPAGGEAAPGPEETAASRQLLNRFADGLATDGRVSARERSYFEMRFVRQLDHGETCEALGISHNAGYTLLSRLRTKARDIWQQVGGG